jgi:hypothetical protein
LFAAIATLFDPTSFDLAAFVCTLFVVTLLVFMGVLLAFLREIFIAAKALRIGIEKTLKKGVASLFGEGATKREVRTMGLLSAR